MPDTAPGLAGHHETEPGRVGAGAGRSDDFHGLATLQRLAEGTQVAVDSTGYGGVADVRVDGIGKVHRRRPAWQLHDAAFRGENVYLVREQVYLYMLDKLHRVIGPFPHFHQPLHPAVDPVLVGAGHAAGFILVHPVRRNPVIGDMLHLLGTDLDLDIHVHPEQSGVDGLVAIGLGHGYVILEAARKGFVEAVYGTKDPVAVVFGIGDDPERVNVHDFMEGFLLELHLVVDAVQVLFPAQNPPRQAALFKLLLQFATNILDDFAVAAPELVHRF